METKGVTCKIPLDLHNRITEEIKQNESTMSKFIEQIILEHYAKGAITMGKTRTMAFQVSEELFQQDDRIDKLLAVTSEAQAYKQAGNGVTVTVVEAIGRRLAAVDAELRGGVEPAP